MNNQIETPHKIYFNDTTQVYQLPSSKYAIIEINGSYRVIECYLKEVEGIIEVRTRGDLPFCDYDSIIDAFKHIKHNFKVEVENLKK